MLRRFIFCMGLFAATSIAMLFAPPTTGVHAADTKQEAALRKQLNDAQRDLQQANAMINKLQTDLKKNKADDTTDDKTIQKLKQDLQQANNQINQLQSDLRKSKSNDSTDDKALKNLTATMETLKKTKFVHTVQYRLKSDAPKNAAGKIIEDVSNFLSRIKTVRMYWVGKPPKSDSEFQVQAVFVFDDENDFNIFMNDPQMKKFMSLHEKQIEKIQNGDLLVPPK